MSGMGSGFFSRRLSGTEGTEAMKVFGGSKGGGDDFSGDEEVGGGQT